MFMLTLLILFGYIGYRINTGKQLFPIKRDQLFVIFAIFLLFCFHFVLTSLAEKIQQGLLTVVLVYLAWNAAVFVNSYLVVDDKKERITPTGKAVLITGCDTGFGHYLANKLARKGYYVFAGCLSDQSDGAKLLQNRYSPNTQLSVIEMDVTSDQSVEEAKVKVELKLKQLCTGLPKQSQLGLWAVVNNAGIMNLLEIEFGNMAPFERQFGVNCFGVVRVTKAFLSLVRRNQLGGGRIVNVASLAGRFVLPGFSAYCMSKGAVISFSEGLRREIAKWNIDVVTIEPHLYKTGLINEERLQSCYDEGWRNAPEAVREDYGRPYFDGFIQLMDNAMGTAREQVDQVVNSLEDAVTLRNVEPVYRVMKHWERIRVWFIENLVPVPVVDFLIANLVLNQIDSKPQMLLASESESGSNSNPNKSE